jgi:hypothetical protein
MFFQPSRQPAVPLVFVSSGGAAALHQLQVQLLKALLSCRLRNLELMKEVRATANRSVFEVLRDIFRDITGPSLDWLKAEDANGYLYWPSSRSMTTIS